MKDSKRFRILLISLLTMLLAMSCTVFTAIATTEFKMIDGASIRVAQTADGYYGIRFGAQIADTEKNYKMLIIPEDYYDGYLSATDKNDRNVVEYLIDKFGESNLSIVQNCVIKDGVAYGSILRVKYNNLNRGFLGVAYYETESEGNTVYNTAAFATERPNAYTIAEIAAENYDYYVEQGADEAVAGLKNIIFNALNQKNGISESDSANTTPVINVVEESKKVFVGEAFTLSYENAVASSLIKYTGENVSVDNDGNITVNVAGTTTITADLLGLTDTVSVTAVSKNIANLKGTGKTITWDKVVGADKYIITVNGTEYETATNSYTLTTGGVYNISVCAVVGEAKGNAASLTKYSTATDNIALHNMTNVSFTELSHESGNITFTHEKEDGAYVNNNAASIILKNSYGSGQFIKLGFTATANTFYGNKQSISIARKTDDATSLNGTYSLQGYSFTTITLTRGWDSPINYTTEITNQPSIFGRIWAGELNKLNNMAVGERHYIAIGWEETADDTLFHVALFDKNDTLLTAIYWKLSEISAADARNIAPEAGYIGIHSWGTGVKNVSYEILSKEELFANANIAPGVSVSNGKVSFTHPLAENYLVSINGGSYEVVSANNLMLDNYGIYTISVKAVYGITETEATTITTSYFEDDISLYNMSGLTINDKLNYEQGNLTYTYTPIKDWGSDAWRHSATVLLKNQYGSGEFIKVGFTATASTLYDNKIGVSFRRTTNSEDSLGSVGDFSFAFPNFGGGLYMSYAGNTYYNYMTGVGAAEKSKGQVLVGSSFNLYGGLSTATGSNKYYIVAGVEDTATDKLITFALLDSKEEVLKLVVWNYSDFVAGAASEGVTTTANWKEMASTGYFGIHTWGAQQTTIDYEITTRDVVYSKLAVVNAATHTKSTTDGVTTINIGANQTSATVGMIDKFTNEFVKVRFTAVGNNFNESGIRIGLRQSSINTAGTNCFMGAAYGIGLVIYQGGNLHVNENGKVFYYDSTNFTSNMGATAYDNGQIEEGHNYYIIAGAVTDETDTTFYFIFTDADGNVLFASYVLQSTLVSKGKAAFPESGYLTVTSTLATERTITYEILTEEEGMAIVNSIA